MARGYFGIGIERGKDVYNIGTLWRSAQILGASFIFTIGHRYKNQRTDTMKTWRHVPLFHYDDFGAFTENFPLEAMLIGVELHADAVAIGKFRHPEQAVYILGAEDHGLSDDALKRCDAIVQLPGDYCLNVATAGSIVMFDRHQKHGD